MEDLKSRMLAALGEDRKRDYLLLCKVDYAAAVSIALELFPDYYRGIVQEVRSGTDAWHRFNSKAEQARKDGREDAEELILEEAVQNGVDTPGTYERLASIYGKRKELAKAYHVCERWFSSVFWKIPNAATTSLKLLDRMQKLKAKMENEREA